MRTHFTFEDEKDLVLLVRSYEDGGNRISWADTPHKMQRTGHPASTRKLRLRTMMRTWGNDVKRFSRCFFTQVRRPRDRSPAVTRQLRALAAAPQPRRIPLGHLQCPPSPNTAAADLLAVAGASTNAQGAEVLCSVGLDAGKVEQVVVVDVAKVKQSAVVDAAELQDSAIVSVSDESAADANSETTVDDDDSLDAQFLTEDNLR
ncbi:hypothetical protein PC128_g13602 [Phytophthora cactorum]|nr:hypothetical protein PC128_g13602 [Phytophthora cactorum]